MFWFFFFFFFYAMFYFTSIEAHHPNSLIPNSEWNSPSYFHTNHNIFLIYYGDQKVIMSFLVIPKSKFSWGKVSDHYFGYGRLLWLIPLFMHTWQWCFIESHKAIRNSTDHFKLVSQFCSSIVYSPWILIINILWRAHYPPGIGCPSQIYI